MSLLSSSIGPSEAWRRLEQVQKLYNELLFAVVKKFPNESRHETALRYIREAESASLDVRAMQPEAIGVLNLADMTFKAVTKT